MSDRPEITTAEATDRHSSLLLGGVLFFSLKYATSAAMHLVDETVKGYLDYLELGLAIVGVAMIVPVCVWKLSRLRRLPTSKRILYFAPDSFTVDAIERARKVSWATVFFLLILLEIASGKLTQLPSEFFLQVTLSVMLGVFAGMFFYVCRAGDEAGAEVVGSA